MLVMLQEFFSIHSGIDRKGVKKIYVYHIFNGMMRMSGAIGFNPLFWKK